MNTKKNVYPVHTPAAVDYIMFNFVDFLSSLLEILYRELLLKKAAIYGVKEDALLVWTLKRNRYTYLALK
jgi:hypothetical protein